MTSYLAFFSWLSLLLGGPGSLEGTGSLPIDAMQAAQTANPADQSARRSGSRAEEEEVVLIDLWLLISNGF